MGEKSGLNFQTSNINIAPQDSQNMENDEEEIFQCSQNLDEDVVQCGQNHLKRKHDDDELGSQNKRRGLSLSEEVLAIDPCKNLSIHSFISDVEKDPVVREYVDKLLELQFFPAIPDVEKVSSTEPVCDAEIPNNCHSEVIKMMMDFLRINYFRNNMAEATENGKTVINVHARLSIPCFQTLPYKTHEDMMKLRRSAALQIQTISADGSKFNAEFMCVRSAHLLLEEIKKQTDDNTLRQELTQHQFELHFYKASMEFAVKFNIKKIDWKVFISKVKLILPKWRKDEAPPPTSLPNHYATEIVHRINRNEVKFDLDSVKTEFDDFIKGGEAAIERMKHSGKFKFISKTGQSSFHDSRHASSNNFHQRPKLPAFRRNQAPSHNNPNFNQRENHRHQHRHHQSKAPYNQSRFPHPKPNGNNNPGNENNDLNVPQKTNTAHADMPSVLRRLL